MRRTEEGESVQGREREQRGRKRSEGTREVVVASPGGAGGGQGEAGGGRGLSGTRHASPLFVLLAEEEEDKGRRWAGPAGPVLLGHQVGFTGKSRWFCSFFLILFCFSFI